MKDLFLTPEELAERWHVSSPTIKQWRCHKKGPQPIKINGRVLYELKEIEKFEENKRQEQLARRLGVSVNSKRRDQSGQSD